MRRTFLLGAGFSKAVADDAPVMNQVWKYIEGAHKREQEKHKKNRHLWFDEINEFVTQLEDILINELHEKHKGRSKAKIRENIEFLFTLIDVLLMTPEIEFRKTGDDISPYRAIPTLLVSEFHLREIKSYLLTYLYLVFEKLNPKPLAYTFSKTLNENDHIITFNYDIVLEKTLWNCGQGIWSPLNGYVGVDKFEFDEYKKSLEEKNKHSKLKIHKMHGSITWDSYSSRNNICPILITLDKKESENNEFHFKGLEQFVKKDLSKPSGYAGKYAPPWIVPSFVKPFQQNEFLEIWKSAINVISQTDELIIIGYSFRPEDSHAHILLSLTPPNCNTTIVDPCADEIREKLANMGIKTKRTFKSVDCYLSQKCGDRS